MKAVVGVVLARCPRGAAGHTCAVMNWVIGLRSLGWDVWIAEHMDSKDLGAPEGPNSRSPQEEFWHETAAGFGLTDRQCLLIDGQSPDLAAFREFAGGADFFLNYSGQFHLLDLLGPRATRCYLDVDPGFTQLWAEACGCDMNFVGHDLFFTVGTNIGKPGVLLPRSGRDWIPLVPPMPAAYWRDQLAGAGGAVSASNGAWTTVAHWYGYNDLFWEGRTYGGKRESLLAAQPLPLLTGLPFAIASDMEPGWTDYGGFLAEGWQLLRSADVCRDVPSYLRFLAGSRGEIGIAKGGYLVSRGGWISDRSLLYLALGVPVVLQDTGWPEVVPPGPGFLPFSTCQEAAARIREVESNRPAHCAGARATAEEFFQPATALAPLLGRLA